MFFFSVFMFQLLQTTFSLDRIADYRCPIRDVCSHVICTQAFLLLGWKTNKFHSMFTKECCHMAGNYVAATSSVA